MVLNSIVLKNKKKQVKTGSHLPKKYSADKILAIAKPEEFFVYHKMLINNTLFKVKKIKRLKSKQNCYIADKVLSFVSPSGEQELT